MKWYYIDESIVDGERRKGPYDLDEIKELVQDKKIVNETLVWHSGLKDFIPWQEMDEAKETTDRLSEEELLKQTITALLEQQQQQKRYAGFFPRLLAFLIDSAVVGTVSYTLLLVLTMTGLVDFNPTAETINIIQQSMGSQGSGSLMDTFNLMMDTKVIDQIMSDSYMMTLFIGSMAVEALYFIIFTATKGATLGKMALRMHVETADGDKMGWVMSITRYIASVLNRFTFMLYGFGYLIVMLDPKRRALHDHIARTRVVMNNRIRIVGRSNPGQEQ